MPCEPTNDEVLKQLKEKIKAGLYTMGEAIVPQKFQNLSINKDGEAEIVDVVVSGRKYPLLYTNALRLNVNNLIYLRCGAFKF